MSTANDPLSRTRTPDSRHPLRAGLGDRRRGSRVAAGSAELLRGSRAAAHPRGKGPREARDAGHALRLPAVGAARERPPLRADAHRQNVFRRLRGAGGRGAGGFRIVVGRRADAAVGADRSRTERRTVMDLELDRSHVGGPARRRSDRRAAASRGSPSTRHLVWHFAIVDRPARAVPRSARADDHGSSGSRSSRGSKGLRSECGSEFSADRRTWNRGTQQNDAFGTLGTIGTVGTWLPCSGPGSCSAGS